MPWCEPQEPDRVGNGGTVFAGPVGNFLMAEMHLSNQPVEGLGGLDGIQVFALDILDQRDLEETFVGVVLNDNGDVGQAGDFGRPQTPLTGDEFVVAGFSSNDKWLYYPICLYGVS